MPNTHSSSPSSEFGCSTLRLEQLRAALVRAGILQKDFAAVCGLSPEHLSRILAGRSGVGELSQIKIKRGLSHYRDHLKGQGRSVDTLSQQVNANNPPARNSVDHQAFADLS